MNQHGSDTFDIVSAGEQAESPHVAPSKLTPPPLPKDVAVRHRLMEKLIDTELPVILVVAPAGFGKSLLMSQFQAALKSRRQPVAWLSLDERDNDFGRFIAHFQEVIRGLSLFSVEPNGSSAASNEYGLSDIRDEAFAWLDHIASLESPFSLFLDEFESIGSSEVHVFIADLLRQLSPGQRVIIVTRVHGLSMPWGAPAGLRSISPGMSCLICLSEHTGS